ncbi:O-antigen ligase family protein [Geobacillus stearothermophilus]|uniref:O-antigen ligase family protein n=1 Tax=Geobacillus stearothermophilus TaxID=1422 RepID=UPI003D1FB582
MQDLQLKLQKKVLFWLIILTPIIDTINGLIIYNQKNIPLGVTYRFIFLVTLFLLFFKNTKISTELLLFYFIFLYLFINPIITSIINNNLEKLSVDFEFASRIILFFVILFTLYKIIRSDYELLKRAIEVSCWIVSFTIIIPFILGLGNNSYVDHNGVSVGFKGFYYSNNALNVVMIILFIFCLDEIFRYKINLFRILKIFLVFVSTIIIGSKSSLFYAVVMFLVYMVHYIKRMKMIQLIALFLGVFLGFLYFKKYFFDIINMQMYRLVNNDFMTYLLSGRNEFLNAAADFYFSNLSITSLLFGLGNNEMTTNIGAIYFGRTNHLLKGIEMDLFDLFFNMGLITLLIFLTLYIYILYKCYILLKIKNVEARPFIYSYIALLFFSILGGHVITEAFSITFFGVVTAGILSIYENAFKIKKELNTS